MDEWIYVGNDSWSKGKEAEDSRVEFCSWLAKRETTFGDTASKFNHHKQRI